MQFTSFSLIVIRCTAKCNTEYDCYMEISTVDQHIPHAILCGYFYARANTSALHIIASPPDVFTSQHPPNASVRYIITL